MPISSSGRESFGSWADWQKALPVVKGDEMPADERDAWEWLRNPLPPGDEEPLFATCGCNLGFPENAFFTDRGFGSLGFLEQQAVGADPRTRVSIASTTPSSATPFCAGGRRWRRLVCWRRLAWTSIPTRRRRRRLPGRRVQGLGLLTNLPFDLAYQAAEAFTDALKKRTKAAGFMKTLLAAANLFQLRLWRGDRGEDACAAKSRGRRTGDTARRDALSALTPTRQRTCARSSRSCPGPKPRPEAGGGPLLPHRASHRRQDLAGARLHHLQPVLRHRILGRLRTCEVAAWRTRRRLCRRRQERHVPWQATSHPSSARRSRRRSRSGKIRLVVATDAACEGLNLQTLGTLINVDLPWNPSRLEQRLGRIKRFGQARRTVDMLNLVYHDTQDEKVYQVLSRRMKDRYDIFGGLPDTIEDDWIETVEKLEEMMDKYIHLRQKARDVFEMRYQETIDPDKNRWELCSRVLARKDVIEKLSESW